MHTPRPDLLSRRLWWLRHAVTCLCLTTLLAPAVLHAKPAQSADDRRKASAKTMAEQAGKAYESGDFQRAALLYINAFQTDEGQPDYLFAAARAAHVGGLLDMALEHYNAYLKVPGIDPGREKKARGYIEDVQEAKAAAKGADAEKALRTGDVALAAQLYSQAAQIAPHRHEYTFKCAVARQQAGQLDQAEALLAAYLAQAPADAPDRPEAEVRLASLRKAQAPVVVPPPAPVPRPQPVVVAPPPPVVMPPPVTPPPPVVTPAPVVTPPPVVKPPEPPKPAPAVVKPAPAPVVVTKPTPAPVAPAVSHGPNRAVGWVLVGGGVVLLAASGALLYQQWVDTQAYQNPTRDVTGLITNMTASEGNAKADTIDRNRAAGGVCAALGVAGVTVGIWQLVRTGEPARVTVLPTLDGAVLAGRF